jgi:hypothetical protein
VKGKEVRNHRLVFGIILGTEKDQEQLKFLEINKEEKKSLERKYYVH